MNFRLNYILTSAIVLLISAVGIPAQDAQIAGNLPKNDPEKKEVKTAAPNRSAVARIGVQQADTISLTLNDAIRKALEKNNAIEISRDNVRLQETVILSQKGVYDPVFTVSPSLNRNSRTGQSATQDLIIGSSLRQQIKPGGGSYQVFFNNNRTENAFSQQEISAGQVSGSGSAVYSSISGVSYTQPLFRNFLIDNNRRQLKIAKRVLEQTDTDFRRQTIEIIAQVQSNYWELVYTLRDQQNRLSNLNLAKENLRQVEARIEAGASAPLSRAEIATELANREADLLIATQQVAVTENALKQLILADVNDLEWSRTYVPTDRPLVDPDPVNMDNAIKDALDNRFELQRLKLDRDINKIDISFFKNQTKPQIDLNTTFSLNGLSLGNINTDPTTVPLISGNPATNANAYLLSLIRQYHGATITPPNVVIPGSASFYAGGFNRSLANMFRSDAPNFSVGVTISFPFRNRTAKANLANARIIEHQLEAQTRQTEQTVIVEVRNAVQTVETARLRVTAARTARENAEIQLEGERQLFEAGRSTTFLLLQRENALLAARNQEIRAETDYNKAVATLQRATSTTLTANSVVVDSPADGN